MDPMRWERIQSLFHRALELPTGEREPFLAQACGAEPALAAEVRTLLEEDARASSPLDRGLDELASAALHGAAPPPPTIGPYRLREPLGEGGMGVVYLAERADLGQRVAIKLLRDAGLSPLRRERFAREQRVLARLTHPSIARLYDAGTLADGTPYIVMEHVVGVPLNAYGRGRDLPLPERLRLFRAICEAVQFAHRHAIVHRDLKPSNVLVTPEGTVKLLDFGISKELDELDATADQTRTGLRLMTPAYAAPEQIRGEPVGTYTDVYALGVILYELLTGVLPFDREGRGPAEIDAAILAGNVERPSGTARRPGAGPHAVRALSGATWGDLDVLCLTAMHTDPQRRYRTVDALIRDVDHLLAGTPLEARPDSVRYRAGKFLRRNWRAVGAGAAAAVAIVALVAFYTWRLATTRDQARAEAARTQRIQGFMTSLFDAGDRTVGPADTLRVVTLLDRGAREAGALDREPAVQADLYETLGVLFRRLGRLPQADSMLQLALGRRRALYGPEHPDVARSLVALGLLRSDQARFPEAESLVTRGADMGARLLPAGSAEVLRARASLGHVLEERGAYARAIPVLQDVARRQAGVPDAADDRLYTLKQLADTHFYAGNLDAADSLTRVLLALETRRFGPNHPHVADDLIDLGAIQLQRGRYREAEAYYRRALPIAEAHYGTDNPEYASDLTMLARALVYEEGRHAEARALLLRALAIQERVYGPVHPRVASVLNDLGNLATKEDSTTQSIAYFQRMLSIYQQVYGEHHYLLGIATANLASAYLAAKQYTVAEPLIREAVRIFSTTLSPTDLNTGIGRIKLGRVLNREHRFAEAVRESLAGYDIVARLSDPGVSWLQGARKDLVADYDSLGQPQLAARFRVEPAATAAPGR